MPASRLASIFALAPLVWLAACSSHGSTGPDASAVEDAGIVDGEVLDGDVDLLAPPLSLSVTSPLAFGTTNVSLPDAVLNAAYAQSIAVGGGVPPYHVTTVGTLATGLSAAATGNDTASAGVAVSGTPTLAGEIDSHFTVTVTATDAASQMTSLVYDVRLIAPAPSIGTSALPNGRGGVAYATTVVASDGTGTLTWSDPSATLPAGLALSTAGAVSGTPSAAAAKTNNGAYTVTLKVSDSLTDRVTNASTPRTATKSLSQTIDLGYRVNVFPLIKTTYSCTSCHTSSTVPNFTGGQPAGSEDATQLVNIAAGAGMVPLGGASACGGAGALAYVKPGNKDQSLVYLKVAGTTANPPPCGTCMPYTGSCGAAPTMSAADLADVQRWILSIPSSPSANDYK